MTYMAEADDLQYLERDLPNDERIVWRGAPTRHLLATRVFHWRKVAIYFALLMAWRAFAAEGGMASAIGGVVNLAVVAAVAIGLLHLIAYLIARSTVYTLTNRRVVMRFGVALPMTVNLPFSQLEHAGVRKARDGSGDLCLRITPGQRVSYIIMWPHVRPWHFLKPQPALRALPDIDTVAEHFVRAIETTAANGVTAAAGRPGEESDPDLTLATAEH